MTFLWTKKIFPFIIAAILRLEFTHTDTYRIFLCNVSCDLIFKLYSDRLFSSKQLIIFYIRTANSCPLFYWKPIKSNVMNEWMRDRIIESNPLLFCQWLNIWATNATIGRNWVRISRQSVVDGFYGFHVFDSFTDIEQSVRKCKHIAYK